jgi:hypothetical protein
LRHEPPHLLDRGRAAEAYVGNEGGYRAAAAVLLSRSDRSACAKMRKLLSQIAAQVETIRN